MTIDKDEKCLRAITTPFYLLLKTIELMVLKQLNLCSKQVNFYLK